MLEKGNTLVLADDNEYAIVDKYVDNGTTYVYLVDINNTSNFIYGKLENDEITVINNPDELDKVIKQVSDNLHNN